MQYAVKPADRGYRLGGKNLPLGKLDDTIRDFQNINLAFCRGGIYGPLLMIPVDGEEVVKVIDSTGFKFTSGHFKLSVKRPRSHTKQPFLFGNGLREFATNIKTIWSSTSFIIFNATGSFGAAFQRTDGPGPDAGSPALIVVILDVGAEAPTKQILALTAPISRTSTAHLWSWERYADRGAASANGRLRDEVEVHPAPSTISRTALDTFQHVQSYAHPITPFLDVVGPTVHAIKDSASRLGLPLMLESKTETVDAPPV
ncbi:hypothetical protein DFH94DRAFT_678425 [Russula ochroleuca]|uniref:Uncharacterized protein n=1 Tax=Russula ochroleuca TaxID=152965 RepID=A0A9P5TE46_9AGAM|nr:hypothetical protein DFH94DRAFT_678425 [Russula ochroleuca]